MAFANVAAAGVAVALDSWQLAAGSWQLVCRLQFAACNFQVVRCKLLVAGLLVPGFRLAAEPVACRD